MPCINSTFVLAILKEKTPLLKIKAFNGRQENISFKVPLFIIVSLQIVPLCQSDNKTKTVSDIKSQFLSMHRDRFYKRSSAKIMSPSINCGHSKKLADIKWRRSGELTITI